MTSGNPPCSFKRNIQSECLSYINNIRRILNQRRSKAFPLLTLSLSLSPSQVAIYLRTKTGPKQSCGGAVLSEDVVLTAAHCVVKYPPSTYILKIGDFNVEVLE